MTDTTTTCTRCGLPVIGPALVVTLHCAESPPRQPELLLCRPCRESLSRWVAKRQAAARSADGKDRDRPHDDEAEPRQETPDRPEEADDDAPQPATPLLASESRRGGKGRRRSRSRLARELDRKDARMRRQIVAATLRPMLVLALVCLVLAALWFSGANEAFAPKENRPGVPSR
jgi:hypothetical protein